MKTVTAAILRRGTKILLARRSGGAHAGHWEFPGGKLEPGESEESCLARELDEELGIQTTVGSLVAESIYTYDSGQIRLRAYETTWVGGEMRPLVHDQIEWVEPDSLLSFDLLPADVPIALSLSGDRRCKGGEEVAGQ